jgi:hypothetical protein
MPRMKRETEEAVESARLIEEALSETTPTAVVYRDPQPPTPTGAPPVPQPGRPPMSQRATDHASVVLAYGITSVPVGGALSGVLWTLSHVSPGVLAVAGLAPIGLVGAVGIVGKALGRSAKEVAEAMPSGETHHHHTGPTYIDHREVRSVSRAFGRTTNQLPAGER